MHRLTLFVHFAFSVVCIWSVFFLNDYEGNKQEPDVRQAPVFKNAFHLILCFATFTMFLCLILFRKNEDFAVTSLCWNLSSFSGYSWMYQNFDPNFLDYVRCCFETFISKESTFFSLIFQPQF